VSPSLLVDVSKVLPDWVVPKQFLLGLGCPWEPDPWEYSKADELLIKHLEMVNSLLKISAYLVLM